MWQFVFWSSVSVVLYCYVGYPLILLLARKLSRRGRPVIQTDDYPTVCLLISAFNEEKVLRKKIENSLSLDYPREKLSILVASDGSTDRTVSIAQDYEDLGVALFHRPVRSGKSAVLNEALKTIRSEIVVFTDANAMFAGDSLKRLVAHFSDPKIGCVVGKLRYVDGRSTSVSKGEGIYWRYEGMLSVLESSLGSVLVANGSIFAIRRELRPELYPEVANDFQIPIEIGARGHDVLYEPEAVAFEHSTIFWQEEFQRKVRIIVRGLAGFCKLRGKIRGFRRWQFVSHKLLRWAIGPMMLLILVSNVALARGSVFYTLTLAAQLFLYLAAVSGWRMQRTRRPHPLFYLPFYFSMVNLAAVVAIAKFISGQRQRVWEKAESARFAPAGAPGQRVVTALRPLSKRDASLGRARVIDAAQVTEKVAKN
jgi:cellulose synthase/poly-beta-1,6-N-acetylglucosamine synthase-like glycosyltransferase